MTPEPDIALRTEGPEKSFTLHPQSGVRLAVRDGQAYRLFFLQPYRDAA